MNAGGPSAGMPTAAADVVKVHDPTGCTYAAVSVEKRS
jgi:hypothetical protein